MAEHVLVTGGAGYIGSHACKALARQGYVPVVLDNMVYGHEWAVQWGPLVKGDIHDRSVLDHCFSRYRPSAVMHFAAFAYVGESVLDPARYYRNNVSGTIELLEAMRAHGCGKIIFSSTCAVYGIPRQLPLTEDHPCAPINPYGASKLMIERILADYRTPYGLDSLALRYFNAAGADPQGLLGEAHSPETHLIPLALKASLTPEDSLTVFGTDHDTPDGTCIRDYIHVSDLADAHVLALQFLNQEGGAHVLNLGTGAGYSVLDVIAAVREATGSPVSWRPGPARPGDPASLVADGARARAVLGWQPRHERLEEMVSHACQWMQRHEYRHV